MVYSRQIKLQHIFIFIFGCNGHLNIFFEARIKLSNRPLLLKLEFVAVKLGTSETKFIPSNIVVISIVIIHVRVIYLFTQFIYCYVYENSYCAGRT